MEHSFLIDLMEGLSKPQKHLSSKYFYDDLGSKIFQDIMHMPEYYLTDSEFEIFNLQVKDIIDKLNFNSPFNLIELGAGDGSKTARLISYLVENNIEFVYTPIDISQEANDILEAKLKAEFPTLTINPQTGDYFDILKEQKENTIPSLLLFIGGNIGNYVQPQAIELLQLFNDNMKKGDKLLLGADLQKNPLIIHQAYQDPHGITKQFNLNLLRRANKELGADFQLDYFDFYCYYNPDTGELKSYLISLREQDVHISKANKTIHFGWGETIWTELSQKYTLTDLKEIGNAAGLETIHQFIDCKHYFTDCLLEKL